jgi:pimeloyl-ACP methyl ester carboxylesterase
VIRFDNRDVGLSTKMDHTGTPNIAALAMQFMTGQRLPAHYALDDMALDVLGLLDSLNIPKAHIVGASMGGMIAQIVAAKHAARVYSLTSIMSTTGNPVLPQARPMATAASLQTMRASSNENDTVNSGVQLWRGIGSPGYPTDEAALRASVQRDTRRSFHPAGAARQMLAIAAGGDRRALCRTITAPTVVLHGADDPLIPVEGGRDTASAIAGAELRVIPGMGHDIPLALVPQFADAILRAASRGRPEV